jgi:hypothetical protein
MHYRISFYIIYIFLLPCCISCFISCVKPPEEKPNTPLIQPAQDAGAFIIQEGNFQWGNASLGYINLISGEIEKDFFKKVNDRPIGDVLQSGLILNSKLWLSVNNSGKIEIIDPNSGKSEHQITGLRSPRYILPINIDKTYISDLYANAITIIDNSTLKISGQIALPGWTENMLLHEGMAWVTNISTSYTYIIDAHTDRVIDSVKTGKGNNSIVLDKNKNIWVLSSGDIATFETAKLVCINPIERKVIKQIELLGNGASKMVIDSENETLFWLQSGVFRLNIHDPVTTSLPWIQENGNYYGLSIHPNNGNLFICDAKDYVSEGRILEFNRLGEGIREIRCGIIPSQLIFYPE